MLKKTKKELLYTLGSDELTKWMAYSALQDEEYNKKLQNEVALEKSAELTEEQRADQIRQLLMGLGK